MNYIAIGRILQTHGARGYLKIATYSGNPDRFDPLFVIYIETDQGMQGFLIEDKKIQDRIVLLKLKNIQSPEDGKALIQRDVLVPEDQKIQLPENEFFIHDLIGLKVFDTQNNYIGVVVDVITGAGNDVYIVRENESEDEILIPAVSDFIKGIDKNAGKMVVELIEGMK